MKVSNEKNVPWVGSRVDSVHTCSNEVLPSSLRQVKSWVASYIIREKFIQKKWIYTYNNIKADM